MHIVVFSITPLFPTYVMGGAQKHVRDIALALGEAGHRVTVLCTQRQDTVPFAWSAQVQVHPVLRFKQPFPGPYDTPAYNLAAVIQEMGDHLATADRLYIHDGEFLFPYVTRAVPTVVSLRDTVYPETQMGAFLFRGHTLILNSDYARQFYAATAGRFLPGLIERMRVIPNGFDWTRFRYTPPRRVLDLIPFNPADHPIILHPHRPEPNKGLPQTIDVVDRLVHRHGLTQVRALVPRWIGTEFSPEVRAFYDDTQAQIEARGLREHIVFHDWVPQDLMPEYYSLGAVTLALGSFTEAFGNAAYESLGCGTPSIIARTASHRDILPETLVDKVDFDDADTAAEIAAAIIGTRRRTSPETLRYLHEHYDFNTMRRAYVETIEAATLSNDLAYRHRSLDDTTRFALAPWCYLAARGIYHDFQAAYLRSEALTGLITAYPAGFTLLEAERRGVERETVLAWTREGYLVPLPE